MRIAVILIGALSLLGDLSAQTIKKVPLASTPANSGKAMFANYCAACHGAEGKGDGPAVAALKTPPPNLTQLTARENGKFPDNRVANILSGMVSVNAHGSTEMPIWGELLKTVSRNDQNTVQLRISNLTDYVKSLQAK